MSKVQLKVKKLPHCKGLPQRATAGSAGLDMCAAIEKAVTIQPGERLKLPTGVVLGIPEGHFGLFTPRSGLASRVGLTLSNSPGVIDQDFDQESQFLLINHGTEPYRIEPGERLGQLVILPYPEVEVMEVDEIEESSTRSGGFGSTGKTVVISNGDSLNTSEASEVHSKCG